MDIREKYKNKDIIEVSKELPITITDWFLSGKEGDINIPVKKMIKKFGGFLKFINSGVLIIKHNKYSKPFPFEFSEDILTVSVYVFLPAIQIGNGPVEPGYALLCKATVDTNLHFNVLEGTFKNDVMVSHLTYEHTIYNTGGDTMLMEVIKILEKTHPHVKTSSNEWYALVQKEYIDNLIKTHCVLPLTVNFYLTLLQKEILISKIEQNRVYGKGKKPNNRNQKNVFYRYEVKLPPNYQPRKFDVNYYVSEWTRSAFTTSRWVRVENAEKLAERRGGKVIGDRRGEYVKIQIPIGPGTCHRRAAEVVPNKENKIYSS